MKLVRQEGGQTRSTVGVRGDGSLVWHRTGPTAPHKASFSRRGLAAVRGHGMCQLGVSGQSHDSKEVLLGEQVYSPGVVLAGSKWGCA